MAKLEEYKNIQTRIEMCLLSMVQDKIQNIIFTGPVMIMDSVDAVITKHNIPIHISGFCENWNELSQINTNKVDALLLSDD